MEVLKSIQMKKIISIILIAAAFVISSCTDEVSPKSFDINQAEKVSVDRFSAAAGQLMVRSANNTLPAPNEPINFDVQPFTTIGLDRTGATIQYYNFDAKSTAYVPIYVFFKNGKTDPLETQNHILPVIPGDAGYNDFWLVTKVMVPDNYVPNSITSEEGIVSSGYPIVPTNFIVNCPVVPFGSTASKSYTPGQPTLLTLGWYKGKAVGYFSFGEASLYATTDGKVPVSPIYVMFNDNLTGPASGFKTELTNSTQTHNVPATLPGDLGYSPLWNVSVLDNSHFNSVVNLQTATSFPSTLARVTVNCPIVK